MGALLPYMKDPQPKVRDSAAWTMGRACDFLRDKIPAAHLQIVVKAFLEGLADSSQIAVTCAWVRS
jgi:importin subunit beta-1